MKKTMTFVIVTLLALTQPYQTYTLTHNAQKTLTIAAAVVGALGGGYACYQNLYNQPNTANDESIEQNLPDKKFDRLKLIQLIATTCAVSALCGGMAYFATSFYTPEAHLRYAQNIISAEQQNPLANQAFPSSDAIHKEIKNTYNNDKTYLVRAYDYLTRSWHRLTNAANSLATAHADTTDAALRTTINPLTTTVQTLKNNTHTNQELVAAIPVYAIQSNAEATRQQTEALTAAIRNQRPLIINSGTITAGRRLVVDDIIVDGDIIISNPLKVCANATLSATRDVILN
jgi:hypothetical protein